MVLDRARKVTVAITDAKRPLAARWFHPLTGAWTDAGTVTSGRHTFSVPGALGDLAVLVVGPPKV